MCRMSSQCEGDKEVDKEVALFYASREGDLVKVILSAMLVGDKRGLPRRYILMARVKI